MKKLIFITIFMFLMADQISAASETSQNQTTISSARVSWGSGPGIGSGEVGHQLGCFILSLFGRKCQ